MTGELRRLDVSGELEVLTLEGGVADLDGEIRALTDGTSSVRAPSLAATVPTVGERRSAPEARETTVPARPATPFAAPGVPTAPFVERAPSMGTAPTATPRPRRVRVAPVRHRRVRKAPVLLTLMATLALGALVALGGSSSPQRNVSIHVDGQNVDVTTRASTVRALLIGLKVEVGAHDAVAPPLASRLHEGVSVRVDRAFSVRVDVDGRTRTVPTTARTVRGVEKELHLPPGMTLVGDTRRLDPGSSLVFRTPHDVSLVVAGVPVTVRSHDLDVASLLGTYGVELGPNDEVTPPPLTRITEGLAVRVYHLAENQQATVVSVPYATRTVTDPTMLRGTSAVVQTGAAGTNRLVYEVALRDGQVVDRSLVRTEVVSQPVARVVAVGGRAPTPTIAPRSSGVSGARAGPAAISTRYQSGSATWYSPNQGTGTCAHLSLPLGTVVTVTNSATGASAQCRVADRGPQAWTGHVIDLTPDVFGRLAPLGSGVIRVTLSW